MKTFVKVVFVLVLLAIPVMLTHSKSLGRGKSRGSPPVITHSFASKEISRGDIWRIYVEANDPDGDMRQFVCALRQVGYGDYSSEYVIIKRRHREKMKGYLTFNSGAGEGFRLPEWTQFSMTIYIRDRGRNTSDKVVFPLTLSLGSRQGAPPPPFDVNGLERLGAISIELVGGRGRSRF